MESFESLGFQISTEFEKINLNKLYNFLSFESYWSLGITREKLTKALNNSLNFSLISPNEDFIGFGRVVTDRATFAYLSDVYIENDYRGKGLGKYLIKFIMNHPEVQNLRRWVLATKDAQEFYRQLGWKSLENPNYLMEIVEKKN